MKWRVTFRQKQTQCCPPGEYWLVRDSDVEAMTSAEAEQKVRDLWRHSRPIEIKSVREIKQGETI
jgi:1,2-phenylacetyl-CoA epoxidase PaaB subunit